MDPSASIPYTPPSDGSHRKLGVKLEGMYCFLEEIGFLEWNLPKLWSSIWTHRRQERQQRGLTLQIIAEEIIDCTHCNRSIPIGEMAYIEHDRHRSRRHNRTGFHESCIQHMIDSCNRYEYSASLGWRYVETYVRGSNLSWFRGENPSIDLTCGYMVTSPGIINMTGYDLVDFVKEWLIKEGLQHLSLAEVILSEDRFAHLRKYVGIATIFWSHIDNEPVIDHCSGTLVRMREAREKYIDQLPPRDEQYWWLDYFSLRQGIDNDFDIIAIVDLIKSIRNVVCSLQDSNSTVKTYLSRSFCLLELFSGINDDMNLICYGNRVHRGVLECQLAPKCPNAWSHYWPKDRVTGTPFQLLHYY